MESSDQPRKAMYIEPNPGGEIRATERAETSWCHPNTSSIWQSTKEPDVSRLAGSWLCDRWKRRPLVANWLYNSSLGWRLSKFLWVKSFKTHLGNRKTSCWYFPGNVCKINIDVAQVIVAPPPLLFGHLTWGAKASYWSPSEQVLSL